MEEKVKRQMIMNYFSTSSKGGIPYLIIGTLVVLIFVFLEIVLINSQQDFCQGAAAFGVVFGLIFMGIGIVLIIEYKKMKKITDGQVNECIEEDLKTLFKKATNKIGVDDSELVAEPVQVIGPRLWDTAGAFSSFKKGNDGIIRYTPINATIINFGQNQLFGYSCCLDLTTGKTLNETTEEFFYKDIVSVSTRTASETAYIRGRNVQLNSAETFTLTTSGGTSIAVLLRDPYLISMMGGGEMPITRAEKAIQVVRKMLREKKA